MSANLPDKKTFSISEAARFLGVSPETLRRWDRKGILKPYRTKGNQRRYSLANLEAFKVGEKAPGAPLSISQAAEYVGVHPETLRRWEKEGVIAPQRTNGNQRRYTRGELDQVKVKPEAPLPATQAKLAGVAGAAPPPSPPPPPSLPPLIRVRTMEEFRPSPWARFYFLRKLAVITLALVIAGLAWGAVPPLGKARIARFFAPNPLNPIVDVNDVFEYSRIPADQDAEARGNVWLRSKFPLEVEQLVTDTLRVVKGGFLNTTQLLGTIFFGEGKRYFITRLGDATLRAATFFERVAIKTGITAGTALKISFEKATQTGNLTGVEVDFSKITDPPSTLTRYGVYLKDAPDTTATAYGVYVEGTDWDYGIYSEDDTYIGGTLEVNDETTITGNLLPGIDSIFDIGAVDREWANLYVDTLSAFGGTLSSLTVTGTSDLQGNVLDTTGNLTLNDTVDISGALNVTGATTLSDTLTVAGATTLSSTLDVSGNTTVGGDLSVTGSVSGGAADFSSLTVTGTSNLQGNVLDTTGNLTLNDTVDISGALNVAGSTSLASTLDVTGAGTFFATLDVSGDASVGEDLTVGANAVDDNDTIYFDDGVSEYFRWDDANGEFDLSDDLNLAGDLTVSGGNVGIGTAANSSYNIDISTSLATSVNLFQSRTTTPGVWDDTYGISVESTNAVSGDGGWSLVTGLSGRAEAPNVTDNLDIVGVSGNARHSFTTSGNSSVTAYGGYFSGDGVFGNNTSYGVRASGGSQAFNYAGTAYGVYGWAASRGSNPAYGLYGYADANPTTGADYGLYADVNPTGGNSYAGYFARGRVQIEGDATATTPDYATGNGELFVLGDIETDTNLYVAGDLAVEGNTTLGDTSTDTVTFNARINSHILPSGDNQYDLGSATYRWRDLYLGPASLNISDTTGTGGAGSDYANATLGFSGEQLQLLTSLQGGQTTGGNILIQSAYPSGGTTTEAIRLATAGAINDSDELLQIGEGSTDFLTILGSGNVGIGTTGPGTKLHVVGEATFDGALYAHDGTGIGFKDDAGGLGLWVEDGGQVGVGTASPSYTFDVSKSSAGGLVGANVYNSDDTNSSSNAWLRAAVGGASAGDPLLLLTVGGQTDWSVGIDNSNSDKLMIGTDSVPGTSPKLTIQTDGNVGIGTTAPASILDIQVASGHDARLRLRSYDSGSPMFPVLELIRKDGDGNQKTKWDIAGGGYLDYGGPSRVNSGDLHFRYGSTGDVGDPLVTFANTGNVGIGTTAPDTKLHVEGADPAFKITNTNTATGSTAGLQFEFGTPGVTAQIQAVKEATSYNTGLKFVTWQDSVWHETMYMQYGNVGIGTLTPATQLEVVSSIGAIYGRTSGTSSRAVDGFSSGASGIGVFGNGTGGSGYGVYGQSSYRALYGNGPSGGTGDWNNWSDIRVKKDIETIPDALDKVTRLRGVNFRFRTDEYPDKNFAGGIRMGLIAQEVLPVVPEVVTIDAEGFYSTQLGSITALLIEATKEQQTQIEEISTQIKQIGADQTDLLNPLPSAESASLVDDEGDLADEEGKIIAGTVEAEEGIFGKLTAKIGEFVSLIVDSIKAKTAEIASAAIENLTAAFIKADRIEAGKVSITEPAAGNVVIPAGETDLFVSYPEIRGNSKVFLTPEEPLPVGAVVEEGKGFKIKLKEPISTDIAVNYWVID